MADQRTASATRITPRLMEIGRPAFIAVVPHFVQIVSPEGWRYAQREAFLGNKEHRHLSIYKAAPLTTVNKAERTLSHQKVANTLHATTPPRHSGYNYQIVDCFQTTAREMGPHGNG